ETGTIRTILSTIETKYWLELLETYQYGHPWEENERSPWPSTETLQHCAPLNNEHGSTGSAGDEGLGTDPHNRQILFANLRATICWRFKEPNVEPDIEAL